MPIRSCEFDHVTKTCIIIGLKIYFQNLVQNKNVFAFTENLPKPAYDILEPQRRYINCQAICIKFIF